MPGDRRVDPRFPNLSLETMQTSDNVSTADRIIDSVCQSNKVTLEGKRWLKLALDPFPDETRICGGFPDMISSKSNVYPLQVTTTISGSAFATPWDCLIAFNGLLESCPLRTTPRTGNRFSAAGQGGTNRDFGGIQVRSALTGTNLDPTTLSTNLFAGVPTDRPFRLLSSGIEVHNETEPLYRSGKVLTFRQPSVPPKRFAGNIQDAAGASNAAVDVLSMARLPENLSDVQNIPDSTNWDAEQGAYIVFAMDGPTNEPNIAMGGAGMTCPWFTDNAGVHYFPSIGGASPNQAPVAITNSVVPFNNCGIYFADLSPQTKLDIVWHLVLETFPPPTDRTLISLSTPSSAYDPEALVLYSKALRQMPIGVPVSENGLGSFFLEAAKSIASWAAPKLLKGLDDGEKKEDHELAKIKAELEILRELAIQKRSMNQPQKPREVKASPNGNVQIVPAPNKEVGKPSAPRATVVTNVSSPKTQLTKQRMPKASNPKK